MNPKPKTKKKATAEQPLFSATTTRAIMKQYLKTQEQRDAIQHQRNLEIADRITGACINSQKALITLIHASMRTLTTTIVALSNPPTRTAGELESYFDDVVTPMLEQISIYQEIAAPGCDEGFLSHLNGPKNLEAPDAK